MALHTSKSTRARSNNINAHSLALTDKSTPKSNRSLHAPHWYRPYRRLLEPDTLSGGDVDSGVVAERPGIVPERRLLGDVLVGGDDDGSGASEASECVTEMTGCA
jgi:hypothetical protein